MTDGGVVAPRAAPEPCAMWDTLGAALDVRPLADEMLRVLRAECGGAYVSPERAALECATVAVAVRAGASGGPELTPEEKYLIEKARDLKTHGWKYVTTNHGVLMTYEELGRLSGRSREPASWLPAPQAPSEEPK